MLCSGLRKRVAPGVVSISLRYSAERLAARLEAHSQLTNSGNPATVKLRQDTASNPGKLGEVAAMQSCLVRAFQLLHSFPLHFSPALHSNMHVCAAHTHCSHCLLYLRIASQQSHSSRRANRWEDREQGTHTGLHSRPCRRIKKDGAGGEMTGIRYVSAFAYCIHTG